MKSKTVLSKILSILLIAAILSGFAAVPGIAAAAPDIYLAFEFTDTTSNPITSVASGSTFFLFVSIAGNPTEDVSNTAMHSYDLLIGFDNAKVSVSSIAQQSLDGNTCAGTFSSNKAYNANTLWAAWASADGFGYMTEDPETFEEVFQTYASGRLFRVAFKALADLSAEDLAGIQLVDTAVGTTQTQETHISISATKHFNIIVTPALSAGNVTSGIYTSSTAAEIAAAGTFTFIDASGASSTLTAEDVTVTLPGGGLVEGENTCTASYNGYSTTFQVTAILDELQSIAITTAPTKTAYTAFETFDPAGMVVTATYLSGKTAEVNGYTCAPAGALEVSNNSVTVTYNGKTANQTITVNPKEATLSWSGTDGLVYNGESKNVTATVSNLRVGDECTVTVSGGTESIAGNHTAEATELSNANYALPAAKTRVYTIAQKATTATVYSVEPKDFDGATTGTGTLALSDLVPGDDVNASGTFVWTDAAVGTSTVNVTGITLSGADAGNYVLSSDSITAADAGFSIGKAVSPALSASELTLLSSEIDGSDDKDYAFDLKSFITGIPGNAGAMSYAVTSAGTYVNISPISDGKLVLNVAAAQPAGTTDSVTLQLSFANYNDAEVTVSFAFKQKNSVTVSLDDISVSYGDAYVVEGVYGDSAYDAALWTYTFSGFGGPGLPTDVGTYTITANYEDDIPDGDIPGHIGTATATLTISQAENAISGLSIEDWTFGDTPKAPTATAAFGEIVYTYSDSATDGFDAAVPTDAGTWYVKAEVAETANYKAASDVTSFSIEPMEITVSGIAVTAKDYDGNTAAVLDDSGVAFSDPGVVGTVTAVGTYDNADAGTTHVVTLSELTLIESSGNYVLAATGNQTTVENAVINPLVVSLTASIDADSVPYTGAEQKPAVTVTYNSKTLVLDKDYTLAYVGDTTNVTVAGVTVTPAAIGNYAGSSFTPATLSYAITAQDITADTVTMAAIADQTYTGEAILPAVTLTCGSYTLAAGTDYSVALTDAEADNVNVGTVSLTVTGLGNFSGSRTASFDIVPAAASGTLTIAAGAESIDPGVVLTADLSASTLDSGAVTYQWYRIPNGGEAAAIDSAAASTYTVTEADAYCELYVVVTAAGNYTGTLQSSALAVNKLVLNETVTLSLADGVVTATFGGAVDPENYDVAWLRDGTTALETDGASYTTVYEDKAHSITVTLTGKGVYTGVVTSDPLAIPAEAPYFKSIEVEAGDRKAALKIEVLDNGAPITEYVITATKVGSDEAPITVTVAEFGASQVVTGLDNENEYSFTVTAKNSVGSTVSDAVKATPFEEDMPDGGGSSYSGSGSSSSGTTTEGETTTEPAGDIVVNVTEEQIAEGGIVTLDVQVDTAEKADEAPSITIVLPENSGSVKLEIPVEDLSATSVVVLVKEDGTEEIVPKAAMTENGLVIETDETVTVKIVDNPRNYKDLADDYWGKEAIDFVTARGLFNGVGDGEFDPSGTMTRAMLVTVLYRLEGEKNVSYERLFSDVANWTWYSDAITWATQAGIVEGYEDGSFGTDDPVTREQIAVILWRLNGKPEAETDASIATGASDWAEDAMRWAISIGLIQGDGNGYNAKGSATRSEVATLLMRYINLLAQE